MNRHIAQRHVGGIAYGHHTISTSVGIVSNRLVIPIGRDNDLVTRVAETNDGDAVLGRSSGDTL